MRLKYDSKDSAVIKCSNTGRILPNPAIPMGSLPQWPKFDPAARAYMELTRKGPVAREGLRRAACDLFLENVGRK
jgi:hypothetical protein